MHHDHPSSFEAPRRVDFTILCFTDNQDPQEHQSKFTHEAVGFGAGFVAMREYEKRQERNGERPKHEFAKEMIAGIAGAEVDK